MASVFIRSRAINHHFCDRFDATQRAYPFQGIVQRRTSKIDRLACASVILPTCARLNKFSIGIIITQKLFLKKSLMENKTPRHISSTLNVVNMAGQFVLGGVHLSFEWLIRVYNHRQWKVRLEVLSTQLYLADDLGSLCY